jgi:hypothetical protein
MITFMSPPSILISCQHSRHAHRTQHDTHTYGHPWLPARATRGVAQTKEGQRCGLVPVAGGFRRKPNTELSANNRWPISWR